jgi:hypothetical protein
MNEKVKFDEVPRLQIFQISFKGYKSQKVHSRDFSMKLAPVGLYHDCFCLKLRIFTRSQIDMKAFVYVQFQQ